MQTNEIQELLLDTIPAWHYWFARPFKRMLNDGVSLDMYYCIQSRRVIRLRATTKADEYVMSFLEKDAAEFREFFDQLESGKRERFCDALRTIHDTFEEQREHLIAQGKLPPCPPGKGEHCQ